MRFELAAAERMFLKQSWLVFSRLVEKSSRLVERVQKVQEVGEEPG